MLINSDFRNALMLAILGLYETIELVKWEGGDKYYVDIDSNQFCIRHNIYLNNKRIKTKLLMSTIRSDGWDY